ncbi:MAG: DUF2306 domain-containing protein [Candidatus Kapabacteria bacterium]|jgi:uncharacterized membrane protein|nr:DUF2306 domain-containing protein [Candidatus Kapabacteria bacterium]
METFLILSRSLHILCGTIAFGTGLIAIVAPKGKTLHRKNGIVYVWSMVGVALTALLMSFAKPELMRFFVPLSFFTLQLTLTGWRALERKNIRASQAVQIAKIDWIIAIASLLSGAVFIGLGAVRFANGGQMGMVSMVFGVIGLVLALRDIRRFRRIMNGKPVQRMEWFFAHLTLMLGAYIATVTAVLVVNGRGLPPLVLWLGPTVVGGLAITVWRVYYTKKFRLTTNNTVPQTPRQNPAPASIEAVL